MSTKELEAMEGANIIREIVMLAACVAALLTVI